MATAPLLSVRDLSTEIRTDDGVVRAVDHVSFDVDRGEVLGIVGESGSGKTQTILSILGLLPPRGSIVSGSVELEGTDLTRLPAEALRAVRGRRIAMIFQDPMTSLNPYLRIGEQLAEVGVLHFGLPEAEAARKAVPLLDRVGIPDATARMRAYPHELSGGMRQRVMIAMALLGEPDLLLADEPTTALDVTIQAQILDLLGDLRRERGLSLVIVTHDLGVVASVCDRVLVLYAGRVVELASTRDLFDHPAHPYTRALLGSVPRVGQRGSRLTAIAGMPPRLDRGAFSECTFAPRCAHVHSACRTGDPPLFDVAAGHVSRCVLAGKEAP